MLIEDTHHTDSLYDSCLDLLVQLVYADVVDKVLDWFVVTFASEHSRHIDLNEDIVEGGTRLDFQFKDDALLSDQVLDLSEGQAEVDTALLHDFHEFAVLSNHSICSFWSIPKFRISLYFGYTYI